MKEHFKEIDVIKGIAILLVILGHSFCTFPIDLYNEFPIFGMVVRSFQMPLFFVASGFLFSMRGGWESLIKKKTIRLLVPYLSFGVLSFILKCISSSFTRNGNIEFTDFLLNLLNGGSYWFLYTLLIIMFIVQLIGRYGYNALNIIAILCISLCLFTDIRTLGVMTLGKVIYYLPFFVLGITIKRWYSDILSIFKRKQFILCATTLLLFLFFLFMNIGTEYIVPLTGIMTVWVFSKILTEYSKKVSSFLMHFGKYSLQYYLNHLLIMLPFYYIAGQIYQISPIFSLLLIFVGATTVSYIMLKIESRHKILRTMCGLSR